MIEFQHDLVHVQLSDGGEPMVFGEILSDQAVCVFIHPTFPGRIRMRKVDTRIEILGHPDMITKFRPLSDVIVCVPGDS